MMTEINWINHPTEISKHLKENSTFLDVYIFCGENFVRAHKIVLAAASPFLKHILMSVQQLGETIIFMPEVSFEIISIIIQFIYNGNVKISSNQLTDFLQLVKELDIKGLQIGEIVLEKLEPQLAHVLEMTENCGEHVQQEEQIHEAGINLINDEIIDLYNHNENIHGSRKQSSSNNNNYMAQDVPQKQVRICEGVLFVPNDVDISVSIFKSDNMKIK